MENIKASEKMYYRVNKPFIVYETIEGETIVMNLKNGFYYSFDGIGPAVWELINAGFEEEQIIVFLAEMYKNVKMNFRDEILNFIEELKSHGIIFGSDESETDSNLQTSDEMKELKVFNDITVKKPLFHRYTDMRDVLLLDPIHDVDEKGWPEPKLRQNGVG